MGALVSRRVLSLHSSPLALMRTSLPLAGTRETHRGACFWDLVLSLLEPLALLHMDIFPPLSINLGSCGLGAVLCC